MEGRTGVDFKFARALVFAQQLSDEFAAFMSREPYVWEQMTPHPDGRDRRRLRIRAKPPIVLAGLTGDAVHNARSALDHLAWRLVEVGGGAPGKYTCFPIGTKEEGFARIARQALKGAALADVDAVIAMAPRPGGDEVFATLSESDNWDKHRVLLPGVAQDGLTLKSSGVGRDYMLPFNPADPVEVYDGMEFTLDEPWFAETFAGTIRNETFPHVTVRYPKGSPLQGRQPVRVMEMVEHVQATVEPLVARIA